jgi:hypothetical protein
MKWFFTFLIIFSLLWVVYKDEMPSEVINSDGADFINSILFPLEQKIYEFMPSLKSNNSNIKIVEIKGFQAVGIVGNIVGDQESSGFVFLYDDNSVVTKNVLSGINKILENNPALVDKFFILAMGSDNKKFEIFLNSFRKVNFVPYYISDAEGGALYTYFYTKQGLKTNDKPLSFFKKKHDANFEEISTGFFTKGRIETLLENNI